MTLIWDRTGAWRNAPDHFWVMDSLNSSIRHRKVAVTAAENLRSVYKYLEDQADATGESSNGARASRKRMHKELSTPCAPSKAVRLTSKRTASPRQWRDFFDDNDLDYVWFAQR